MVKLRSASATDGETKRPHMNPSVPDWLARARADIDILL
jgi:hypothetical protein